MVVFLILRYSHIFEIFVIGAIVAIYHFQRLFDIGRYQVDQSLCGKWRSPEYLIWFQAVLDQDQKLPGVRRPWPQIGISFDKNYIDIVKLFFCRFIEIEAVLSIIQIFINVARINYIKFHFCVNQLLLVHEYISYDLFKGAELILWRPLLWVCVNNKYFHG